MKLGVPLLALFLLCAATGFKAQGGMSEDVYQRNYKVDDYFDDIYPEKYYPAYGSLEDEFVEKAYPLDYELMKDYEREKKNENDGEIIDNLDYQHDSENDGEIIDNLDYQHDSAIDTGISWNAVDGTLKQISVGDGKIVGVNRDNNIYFRRGITLNQPYGNVWEKLDGSLNYVTVGDGKIVGVNSGRIWFRTGISSSHPEGTSWKRIDGSLKQISVGDGKIMGVTDNDQIFFRAGVSKQNPAGTKWLQIDGGLKHISIGDGKIMGVNHWDQIWFRTGVSKSQPYGTGWKQIDGGLKQIDLGDGKIVGVNGNDQIWIRTGVDSSVEYGTGWQNIDGLLKYITVGDGKMMGVNQNDVIYYRTGLKSENLTPTPDVSLEISDDDRIQLKCSFVPVKNGRVYEVKWFSVGKNGDNDLLLDSAVLPANKFSHTLTNSRRQFYIGNTIYAKLRSWIPGQEGSDPVYIESNRFFLGFKLSPSTLSVSPGTTGELTITSTVPILCEDGSSNCTVRLTLESDPIILLSTCSVVFEATRTFPSSKTVTVIAKDGFVNYKNVHVTINLLSVKYSPSPSNNSEWKTPTSPGSVDVTTSSGGKTGQCTSTGDPHIRTFDNLYFNHYYVGDYTLMKSTSRDFEVQVRTHRCATVACNCGVAVREGDDILVVDMCRNGFTPKPRYANNREPARGTYIERSPNGKQFILKFASGAVVKYTAKHWFANNYYADVTVQVPSVDYGKTAGLCGIFDGQKNNDMTARNNVVRKVMCGRAACPEFTESWKVSQKESFFNVNEIPEQLQCLKKVETGHCTCGKELEDQVCNVVPEPPILKAVTKGYVKLAFAGQAKCNELHKKEGGNTKEEKEVVVLPTCKSDCGYPFEPDTKPPTIPDWPTAFGTTEPQAKKVCEDGFERSAIFQKCTGYLTAEMRKGFLDQCIADIQIMDIKGVNVAIKAAMEALKDACLDLITKDPKNLDKNGKVPVDILDKTCPNECSGHGDCNKGICSCRDRFVTEDCSIQDDQKPNPISISGASKCIRGSPEECTDVTIIVKDLIPGMVHCLIETIVPKVGKTGPPVVVPATLISFSEVECRLPEVGNCGDKLYASASFNIKLFNGKDPKNAADKVLDLFVVNENCQGNGCVVNNCCYSNGDPDPKDKKCSWCKSYESVRNEFIRREDVDGCNVHPCDIENGGCDDQCNKSTNAVVCQCNKPGEFLGADGKSCLHRCDIANGGCEDKCDKSTGEVVCQCNKPGKVLGVDGKSCVHPCDIENGGCDDKCDKSTDEVVCQCNKPGEVLGVDGKSCVHPCDIENGGCDDKCDKSTDEVVCQCNKPGEVLGLDGKSCVHPCDIENGGCDDKCDKSTNAVVCQCNKSGEFLGADGKSCLHLCDIANGGCDDKCDKSTDEVVCQCNTPGEVLGVDGKSCVHPCDIENGGCDDKCDKSTNEVVCQCNKPGKVLGADGKSCECSNNMCEMNCLHGFEKDEDGCSICKCKQAPPPGCSNALCMIACEYGFEVDAFGCALCRCKVPSPGHTSYTKINISVHSTYSGNNGPHLSLQMTLNPRLHQSRFVPESCYAARTASEFDPERFYIIRNRFPTLRSQVRYTPTNFELGFDAEEAERLRELLESAERPHVNCRLRICPLPSNSCNFGYRSKISHESFLDRILKENRKEEMLKNLEKGISLEPFEDDEKDEIVHVDAKL